MVTFHPNSVKRCRAPRFRRAGNVSSVIWKPVLSSTIPSAAIWTQFYHGAVSPDGKFYFGGTQDNGTVLGTDSDGPNKWKQIVLADGGYGAVDFINPSTLYASTQGGGFRRSTDGGSTFSSATLGLSGGFLFIAPLVMDPSDPQRLYVGGDQLNRTDQGMSFWTNAGNLRATSQSNGTMSALAIAPTDANHAMFGLSDGSIIRTTRALALRPTFPLSSTIERVTRPRTNAFVSWLAYDPGDKNIAYATYSTIGGVNAPVIFAGAAPDLVGADQANLAIDRSLAGRGEVDVVLIVDGKPTNAVRVTFK